MDKNFGTYFGARAVLPAVLTLAAVSLFCISSAKADVATFSNFNTDGSAPGTGLIGFTSAGLDATGLSGGETAAGSANNL